MTADEIRKLFDAYEYNIKAGLSGLLERNYFESAIRAICDERDQAVKDRDELVCWHALAAWIKKANALQARVVELEKAIVDNQAAYYEGTIGCTFCEGQDDHAPDCIVKSIEPI